jgi:hypothetical protein
MLVLVSLLHFPALAQSGRPDASLNPPSFPIIFPFGRKMMGA